MTYYAASLNTDSEVTNIYKYNATTMALVATTVSTLESSSAAITGKTNTLSHMTAVVDMREDGEDTGRFAASFKIQLPTYAVELGGADGFEIFKLGNGGAGTVTLKYMPVQGSAALPHLLVATVTGDTDRTVTVQPGLLNYLITVFLQYNGSELILVAGDSSDTYTCSTEIPPATSPTNLLYAAATTQLAFDDLILYNSTVTGNSDAAVTQFPYILWDNDDSGVVAVLPVTAAKDEVVTFVDRGFEAGHLAATLDLTSTTVVSSPKLYINEREVALAVNSGLSASAFVTALTGTNSGVVSFSFDGKTENVQFVKTGETSVSATHYRGGVVGQLSFAVRLEGGTGADWGRTKPILGKIPQQFYLPHTGMLNEGISILGTDNSVTSPKALKVTRRDDNIRTVGKVLGSVKNRPTSRNMLEILDPVPFFGASQAPYPASSIIWGTTGDLSSNLPDDSSFAYGITYSRYMTSSPTKVGMITSPSFRSKVGDCFMAFSLDIPYGKLLRGINVNFVGMPAGLTGNSVSETAQQYDWGRGAAEFPFSLAGSSDYSAIFQLYISADDDGYLWRPIPSLGLDSVKVTGANTWKEITFKSIDYATLLDENSACILQGARRVHFKFLLASELTAVTYNGLSYYLEGASKK